MFNTVRMWNWFTWRRRPQTPNPVLNSSSLCQLSLSERAEVVYWAISSYRYWASQMAPQSPNCLPSEWADALNRRRAHLGIWKKAVTTAAVKLTMIWAPAVETCHEIAPHLLFSPCKPLQSTTQKSNVEIFRTSSPNLVIHISVKRPPFFCFPDFLLDCLLLVSGEQEGGFTQILVQGVCASSLKCPTLLSALIHSAPDYSSNTFLPPLCILCKTNFSLLLNRVALATLLMSCNVAPNVG